jgi:hypothetical protein
MSGERSAHAGAPMMAGPSQDEFAALSDRHINKIVIALNKLSPPQRQAVAKSVLSMCAFGAKV